MKTAITYGLLLVVALFTATVLGRFLFDAVDHVVHTIYLVLNVN